MMNVIDIHLWGLKMNNISNNIMQYKLMKEITTCNISCKVSTLMQYHGACNLHYNQSTPT